jgi:hypothetical protein
LPDAELKLRDFLRRTGDLLRAAVPDGVMQDVSPPVGEILSWYGRVRSVFTGARLLIESGYPEESMVLARSMFETSLRLEHLAVVDELMRERLILNEMNLALDRFYGIYHLDAVAFGLSDGLSESDQTTLMRRRRQIASRQARLRLGRLERFPDYKVLARRLKRLHVYQGYRHATEIAHGSPMAQATRTRYPEPNAIAVYDRNDDPEMLIAAGHSRLWQHFDPLWRCRRS